MNDTPKFDIKAGVLAVTSPFLLDEYQSDEEQFLRHVDRLMTQRGQTVVIDLVRAGNLSSTIIALTIAASRKAAAVNKQLTVRMARRNQLAVKISGLEKLVDVQYI